MMSDHIFLPATGIECSEAVLLAIDDVSLPFRDGLDGYECPLLRVV